jgi:hypothetical protein
MRRKAVAKRVTARRLQDPRFVHGRVDCSLQDLFMLMVPSRQAGIYIPAERTRGKYPLPSPRSSRVGILTRNCSGQRHTRLTQFALPPKSIKQFREVFADRSDDRRRQDRHAILSALGVAHDEFPAFENEILDYEISHIAASSADMPVQCETPNAVCESFRAPPRTSRVPQAYNYPRSVMRHLHSLTPRKSGRCQNVQRTMHRLRRNSSVVFVCE